MKGEDAFVDICKALNRQDYQRYTLVRSMPVKASEEDAAAKKLKFDNLQYNE